ncbi:MAG: type II secretion system protein [Candidatus Aureabacteria bacterium]|nr:type II secretion system protein [Candidatus Auribacterota bacterium]
MKKRSKKGFTLLEMTVSIGLWIILMGVFMTSLFFGIRHMMANTEELSEYTRVSLFFDIMQSLVKDEGGTLSRYKKMDNAFLITMQDGSSHALYFCNEKDTLFDDIYPEDSYSIVLSKLDDEGHFVYGQGRRILEKAAPPPASQMTIFAEGYLQMKIMPSPKGFGPYQTCICLTANK